MALPKADKAYPSLDEAKDLLTAMPNATITEKRARAIFALAFLGSLRVDTLVSLRLGDIDCERRTITQDARTARTKNGKILVIAWFPVPDVFTATMVDWLDMMKSRGFVPEDALFPPMSSFNSGPAYLASERNPIAPMTSCCSVTGAFHAACKGHQRAYTPHAAKHTIAAERDRCHLTMEQRKAWSANMDHETEQTTASDYRKLPDAQRIDLMKKIPLNDIAGRMRACTISEKAAMFDEILEKLVLY